MLPTSVLVAPIIYNTLLSDFIKVEKDDTVTSKGKGGDANKYGIFSLVVTSKYLKHDFQV